MAICSPSSASGGPLKKTLAAALRNPGAPSQVTKVGVVETPSRPCRAGTLSSWPGTARSDSTITKRRCHTTRELSLLAAESLHPVAARSRTSRVLRWIADRQDMMCMAVANRYRHLVLHRHQRRDTPPPRPLRPLPRLPRAPPHDPARRLHLPRRRRDQTPRGTPSSSSSPQPRARCMSHSPHNEPSSTTRGFKQQSCAFISVPHRHPEGYVGPTCTSEPASARRLEGSDPRLSDHREPCLLRPRRRDPTLPRSPRHQGHRPAGGSAY